MKIIVKAAIAATCGALIGAVGVVPSTWAQQQPPAATTTPQTTPMQPGPGMGRDMMNMGQQMESMGQQMESGHANPQEQMQMGRKMRGMGQQMHGMGQRMMNEHGNMQMPRQGAAPATPR